MEGAVREEDRAGQSMTQESGERYEIQEELGRGGSAAVVRAYDRVLERQVALKILSGPIANDPEFMSRFEREARLAARLDHPNIVTIYDFGRFGDGRGFISMRLLAGRGLEKILAQEWPLESESLIAIVSQVAAALDYTHSMGMVHRDVKPNNVIVDGSGRATLTDFGIARAFDSARVTMTGLSIGTPRYMAPEQIRGEDVTSAADVYALGVMTFELLAGRGPFEGEGTALMYKIVHETAPPVSALNAGLSAEVAAVVSRALAKEPGERWPSAGAFADALAAALRGTGSRPVAAPPVDQPTLVAPARFTGKNPVPPASTPAQSPPVAAAVAAPPPEPPAPAAQAADPPHGSLPPRGGNGKVIGMAAAAVVVLAVAAGAFLFLSGGDDSKEASASDDETPSAAATATYTAPASTPTSRAATAVAVASSTPPYTATPTNTPTPSAVISSISVSGGRYAVNFTTPGVSLNGTDNVVHVHFFWDTVPVSAAGVPGGGPWFVYGGGSPFMGYTVSERPAGARQMCVLIANPDHSVRPGTGNCYPLP